MTTQYTSILKLALPVQGELSGTWGDVVNDNITSMVEQAIAGRAVVNTWSGNSHTLTTANGTTAESRCAMLEFTDTGSSLSAAGTVVCPALSKIYIAKNASGENVTLKTSSGSGILVPNGRTMFLFCDGTNVVEAVTSTTSLQLGTSTTVTAVLDEDNMASNSATSLATQQSIKAYVDAQVGSFDTLAEVLVNGNTTGGTDISVSTGDDITFADSSKAIFGAGSDLQIYHSGTHSFISDQGTGNMLVLADNFEINSASNTANKITATTSGAVTLFHNNAAKLATSSSGIDVTGSVTADGLTVDASTTDMITLNHSTPSNLITMGQDSSGDFRIRSDSVNKLKLYANGDFELFEDTGTTAKLTWDASAESLNFADNGKATFGAGSDLQIYHDGSNSYIDDAGTGSLVMRGNDAVYLQKYTGENMLAARADGAVELYHNDALKLATTATGIDVTGSVTADGLVNNGDVVFSKSSTGVPTLKMSGFAGANSPYGVINFYNEDGSQQGPNNAVQIKALAKNSDGSGGELAFYTSTGTSSEGADAVERMRIDSSGSVGIGTDSPSGVLHLRDTTPHLYIQSDDAQSSKLLFGDASDNSRGGFEYTSSDELKFMTNNLSEKMRIDSSGNVGIGTSSPLSVLHIGSGADANIPITMAPATGGNVEFRSTSSTGSFTFTNSNGSSELIRIDSSGNVGIGTSSPSAVLTTQTTGALTLDSNDGDHSAFGLLVYLPTSRANTVSGAIGFSGSGGRKYAAIGAQTYADTDQTGLNFYVQPSASGSTAAMVEAMRIDLSGDLIVGGTSSGANDAVSISNTGYIQAIVNGDTVGYFNRRTSDGEILRFQKDGTSVGSLGVNATRPYIASSAMGLKIAGSEIHSTSATGVSTDATYNLGSSLFRWKDLYLSGGAYLGGTAAANKLDDVETGSWTPTLPNGGSLSTSAAGYVKIGNIVHVQFYLRSINATNDSAQFQIGGLPFTTSSSSSYFSAGQGIGYCEFDDLGGVAMVGAINSTYLYFHFIDGTSHVALTNTTYRGRLSDGDSGVILASFTYVAA